MTPLLAAAAILFGQGAGKPVFYYIPHTHWEGAVFLTREEYLQEDLKHILEALRLMERYPKYKFTLDQVAYFKPFLERFPEQAAKFRKYMKEGRLEIVGGMDVMPDVVKPGGESFVRQIQYGKGYCRQALGFDVDVAWLLDTFGHHRQMPQLLKEAGFKSFWFSRGVPNDTGPSEFNWRGLDGSTIPAFWLPGFYGLLYYPPKDAKGFDKFFEDRYNFLGRNARPTERVGLAGGDVTEPEDWAPPLVDQFNARPDAPFELRYAVPTDFANAVAKRTNTPTFDYEMNPIFPGTYSSRTELHQRAKTIEIKLLDAEQLSADCNLAGEKTDEAQTWQAWEPTLFNETHDLASGTMNDHVYIDTVKSFDYSERLADEMVSDRLNRLARHIDTSGPGVPVVVFNPQGWKRSDLVQVEVGFADNGVNDLQVLDPSGQPVASQSSDIERYGDGALMKAKVAFVAHLPACGWTVFHISGTPPLAADVRAAGGGGAGVEVKAAGDTIENDFYRVRMDPKSGAILSILDRKTNREVLSGPANVIARTPDNGDLWELYRSLDGESHKPDMINQPVPTAPNATLSSSFGDKPGVIAMGTVYQEFSVSHPFAGGDFATRVRLVNGVKRVEIETDLVNRERHVRYQALFPLAGGGKNVQEIPFGAEERPLNVEFPAQNWVDFGGPGGGVALLNSALPGNVVTGQTMMLSLLRAVGEGDYNGGDTSETGMELNVKRTMKYALMPHSGDWQAAGVVQAGQELNSPFLVLKTDPHSGPLPSVSGLVTISGPNVVLTSVKPGPAGTTVLRFYESAGQPAKGVTLHFSRRLTSAEASNPMEDTVKSLPTKGNDLTLDLRPFEIKTIKVRLR